MFGGLWVRGCFFPSGLGGWLFEGMARKRGYAVGILNPRTPYKRYSRGLNDYLYYFGGSLL